MMTKQEAKAVPVSRILEMLGCIPERSSEQDGMYLSPFREEKTASLHVNHLKNVWYDHGAGEGGDGIVLVQRWLRHTKEDSTFHDALRWMSNMLGRIALAPLPARPVKVSGKVDVNKVIKVEPISNPVLVRYLESRSLPLSLTQRYLKQVRVENTKLDWKFYAIGFANDSKGWELRTPTLKSSVSPKGLTFIRGMVAKPPAVHVFEGWPDFLSHLVLEKTDAVLDDAIVLNSLSFLKPALALVEGYGYERLYSWTHNDEAGLKALGLIDSFVRSEPGLRHRPMNRIYAGSKDLNEHLNKQTCAVAGKVQP